MTRIFSLTGNYNKQVTRSHSSKAIVVNIDTQNGLTQKCVTADCGARESLFYEIITQIDLFRIGTRHGREQIHHAHPCARGVDSRAGCTVLCKL